MATKKISDDTMLFNYCDCSLFNHAQCFELGMKYEDVKACCHQGECDGDVEATRQLDYMRKQLDKITCDQMFGYIMEYMPDSDIKGRENDREWLEAYTVWLSAGDLLDEIMS